MMTSAPRLRTATSGGVAQPNTPETDLLESVQHVVSGTGLDGHGSWTVLVYAAAPDDAMEKVSTMSELEFAGLERVEDQLEFTNKRFQRRRAP